MELASELMFDSTTLLRPFLLRCGIVRQWYPIHSLGTWNLEPGTKPRYHVQLSHFDYTSFLMPSIFPQNSTHVNIEDDGSCSIPMISYLTLKQLMR